MPEKARLSVTVFKDKSGSDAAQVPASGATASVRPMGARANGGGSIPASGSGTINVFQIGSLAATQNFNIGTNTAPTGRVDSITGLALSVTNLSATTALTWSDGDRLVRVTEATAYSDVQGTQTVAQPLSDSRGEATAYYDPGYYEARVSGSGVTTRLLIDLHASNDDSAISHVQDGATAVGFVRKLSRTLATVGAKAWRILSSTDAELCSVDKDGILRAAAGLRATAGGLTVDAGGATIAAGGLTVSAGGATITGNSTVTGTLGGLTGLTVASGGASITGGTTTDTLAVTAASTIAGQLTHTSLNTKADRLILSEGIGVDPSAGDMVLSAGWGNTATILVVGTIARDSTGYVRITANGTGIAANPTVAFTWKDGSFFGTPTVVASRGDSNSPTAAYWKVVPSGLNVVWTFVGTPVAATAYDLLWITVGRI